jgi:magnesium transporter
MKNLKRISKPLFETNDKKVIKTPGTAPGTLVFTGKQKVSHISFINTLIDGDDIKIIKNENGDIDRIQQGKGMTWLDVIGIHDPAKIEALGEKYGIGKLILEDILNVNQNPKYIDLGSSNFLTFQSLFYNKNDNKINKEQISIFFNSTILITFREDDSETFKPIYERLSNGNNRFHNRKPDYLTYAVMDLIVDKFLEATHYIDMKIEEFEVKIENHPDNTLKQEIFYFRRSFLEFMKAIPALRESIAKMKSSFNEAIQAETKIYLADLLDHSNQLFNLVDTYNEMIYGLYDLYHAEINYRTNNIIKTLTIISTIFIPLTFIVGVYGMNFRVMPELEWQYGYPFVWIIMVVFSVLTLVYFRFKKWI